MFKKMKVGTRLYMLVGFMSALLIFIGGLGLISAQNANNGLDTVYKDRVVPLQGLKTVADMYAVNIVDTSHKVRDGALTWEQGLKNIAEAEKTVADKWKAYLATTLVAEEKKIVDEIAPLMKKADIASERLAAIMKQQDREGLRKYAATELYPAIDPVSGKFGELVEVQLKVAKEEFDKSVKEYQRNRLAAIISIVFGVVLAVLVSFFLIRNLTRQLGGEPWYLSDIARSVAEGDLSCHIETAGKHEDSVVVAMDRMVGNIRSLAGDTNKLVEAALAGSLSTRADSSRHKGEYRAIVEGMNGTLDAVVGPLNVAAEYIDRISKGEIPRRIDETYNGDFNEVKNNLNVLIAALESVTSAAETIAQGDLSVEVQPRSANDQLMLALKSMVTQLRGLAQVAKQIADGDLTVEVQPASPRDAMGHAFVAMVRNLREIVGNVSSSSDSIATASRQIASGNTDLAQRTEEQASSLEQTAASMEELTSTVKQNAENSQQANQLAVTASEVAARGGAVIEKVVATMESISDSSKKISDIIGVIDGIAFQTNILALNAAVEAARAGEQGRGFAVVAGEVRNLAQRSAAAAKEIKSLIVDSVDKVQGGSALVGEAGDTMKEVVGSIKRVTDIVAEISAASIEQSSGIEQVNGAITTMDQITQQNSSLVQEAASASGALQEQADVLVEAVSRFRLDLQTQTRRTATRAGNQAAQSYQAPPPANRKLTRSGSNPAQTGYEIEMEAGDLTPRGRKAVGQDEEWDAF